MFTDEQLNKIDACSSIREILRQLQYFLRWDDHLILTAILDRLDSKECEELLGKYDMKINCQMKLEQTYEDWRKRQQEMPTGFLNMVAVVRKKYSEITKEEYDKIKHFISEQCGIESYVMSPFVKMSSSSVLLEWMIPPIAVIPMVEMAYKNRNIFISTYFTFLRIDIFTILDLKTESSAVSVV